MDVLYFAWVRERIGVPKERIETGATTVAELVDELKAREPRYEAAFADLSALRVAVDQELADFDAGLAGVREVAEEIAGKSPLAMAGTKEMLNYARDHTIADGLNYVAAWNAAMLGSADLMEAMQAQKDKRPAQFEDLMPPTGVVSRRK